MIQQNRPQNKGSFFLKKESIMTDERDKIETYPK